MLSASLEALNMDMVVTDCWGIIYDQSSYTQKHNHFPADFSCSIYLEAHENSAPIIFADKLHIKPKPNMLVMFPGILIVLDYSSVIAPATRFNSGCSKYVSNDLSPVLISTSAGIPACS